MASSSSALWWMTPLQVLVTLGTTFNAGGSFMQSALVMPTLMIPSVPATEAAKMTAHLLANSYKFFPRLNALCTLANVALGVTAYLYRSHATVHAAKWHWFGVAGMFGVGVTTYTFSFILPRNRQILVMAEDLKQGAKADEHEEKLRKTQKQWIVLNYGRVTLLVGSACASMYALLLDSNRGVVSV